MRVRSSGPANDCSYEVITVAKVGACVGAWVVSNVGGLVDGAVGCG